MKGQDRITLFWRELPRPLISKALAVLALALRFYLARENRRLDADRGRREGVGAGTGTSSGAVGETAVVDEEAQGLVSGRPGDGEEGGAGQLQSGERRFKFML